MITPWLWILSVVVTGAAFAYPFEKAHTGFKASPRGAR
jgi:hypothetical protein